MTDKTDNVLPFKLLIPGGKGGPKTVWDATRDLLAHYERAYAGQPVPRIFIVVDAPQLTVAHAGEKCRPTDAAGLLMGGAHMFFDQLPVSNDPSP